MSHELKITKDLENKTLTLEREFDAPKDKVWQAYADKEMFEKWWGPKGWETTVKEFNFTPGGSIHYGMKCVDEQQTEWFGQTAWGVMAIDAVDAPNSFVYADYFSDENATLNQDLPVLKITNTFVEENGITKLISRSVADTAEQIEEVLNMGMADGLGEQLLKLDALLAK